MARTKQLMQHRHEHRREHEHARPFKTTTHGAKRVPLSLLSGKRTGKSYKTPLAVAVANGAIEKHERKPPKFRPAVRMARCLRRMQKTTECLMPRARASRMMREALADLGYNHGWRVSAKAVEALRQLAEARLINLVRMANDITIAHGSKTVGSIDIELADCISSGVPYTSTARVREYAAERSVVLAERRENNALKKKERLEKAWAAKEAAEAAEAD